MAVSEITVYTGVTPNKATQTPTEFANYVHPFMAYISEDFTPGFNTSIGELNSVIVILNNQLVYSNYQGDYNALTTYAAGASVTYGGKVWYSKVAGNLGNTPVEGTYWTEPQAIVAARLATPRNINGVAFDGSADIEIEDRLGTAIASAATTTIGTAGLGETIHITGTTTITSFGTAAQAGVRRTLIFDGALTLTHNATSLICPGAENITTAAGDSLEVVADTTANWRVVRYTKAAGTVPKADTLTTARTINGVAFDGSGNVNIEDRLGSSKASAATVTIGTAGLGETIHITGTTTITSFGTASQAGVRRTLVFDGALTLTHNATTLILPGGANITTAAGDSIEVVAETTANWRVVRYTKAAGTVPKADTLTTARNINGVAFDGSGNINIEDRLGTAIASAATVTIGTVGLGDYIHITGTTTITSFGTAGAAGIRRTLIFDGVLTVTHNATSLICPGAANIVTVAGTVIELIAETTANWRVVSITHPSLSMAELGYLNGVTGDIQTQLGAKLDEAGGTMTGAITSLRETKVAVAASAIDLATGNLFTKTIGAKTTFTVSNVPASGQAAHFVLELTNGGAYTVTWFSGVKWAGGVAPTLTTSGVDIIGFYSHDGGTTWRGVVMSKDSK